MQFIFGNETVESDKKSVKEIMYDWASEPLQSPS